MRHLFIAAAAALVFAAASCSSTNVGLEPQAARSASADIYLPGDGSDVYGFDATNNWNTNCSRFNFRSKSSYTANMTVGQCYTGSNFAADAAGIAAAVNQAYVRQLDTDGAGTDIQVVVAVPDLNSADSLNSRVESWGTYTVSHH